MYTDHIFFYVLLLFCVKRYKKCDQLTKYLIFIEYRLINNTGLTVKLVETGILNPFQFCRKQLSPEHRECVRRATTVNSNNARRLFLNSNDDGANAASFVETIFHRRTAVLIRVLFSLYLRSLIFLRLQSR